MKSLNRTKESKKNELNFSVFCFCLKGNKFRINQLKILHVQKPLQIIEYGNVIK